MNKKQPLRSPRSTAGTITEIYDYLRLLYARVGIAYSYNSGKKMIQFTDDQIIDLLLKDFNGISINILAPIVRSRKSHYAELFHSLSKKGYLKVRIDGEIIEIRPSLKLDRYKTHDIEVVVDRLKVNKNNKKRLLRSITQAMNDGDGSDDGNRY